MPSVARSRSRSRLPSPSGKARLASAKATPTFRRASSPCGPRDGAGGRPCGDLRGSRAVPRQIRTSRGAPSSSHRFFRHGLVAESLLAPLGRRLTGRPWGRRSGPLRSGPCSRAPAVRTGGCPAATEDERRPARVRLVRGIMGPRDRAGAEGGTPVRPKGGGSAGVCGPIPGTGAASVDRRTTPNSTVVGEAPLSPFSLG